VIPLPVAGAFHTEHMAPAETELAAIAEGIWTREPERMMLSNADGSAVSGGRDTVTRLVRQVTAPVRWDLVQANFRTLGIDTLIELPPAGTLTGLAKRELRGVELLPVHTPDDLAAARRLISAAGAGEPLARLSPATGVVL
jgi:[acyl-carrier-protein] S-malonyltransferase